MKGNRKGIGTDYIPAIRELSLIREPDFKYLNKEVNT